MSYDLLLYFGLVTTCLLIGYLLNELVRHKTKPNSNKSKITPEMIDNMFNEIDDFEQELDGKIILLVDEIGEDLEDLGDCMVDIEDELRFIELVSNTPDDETLYLIITSDGGSVQSSDAIVRVLRERENTVAVVPYKAYSAASLIALATEKLIVGPYGLLSPFDPQMGFMYPNTKSQMFSSKVLMDLNKQDSLETTQMYQHDAKIYHEDNLKTVDDILKNRYSTEIINKVKDAMCKGDVPHSKPFHRTDLIKLGLEVDCDMDERFLMLASMGEELRRQSDIKTNDKIID